MTQYVVKRISTSGGTEYLLPGVKTKYRWGKTAKELAVRTSLRTAGRLASQIGGRVAIYL